MLSIFKKITCSREFDYLMIIFGFMAFGVISLSFFDEMALRISPVCISMSKYGTECSLCGMTRSFVAISNLEISRSFNFNKAGIPLYTIFLLNIVIASRRVYKSYNKKKR